MQLAELQAVATNIVVISVALLAVAIVMFSAAWQGLFRYIGLLSAQGRREISNLLSGAIVVSSIVYGALIAMGIVGPDLVQSTFLVVVLGIILFGIGYLVYIASMIAWNILWHRRLPRFRRSKEPDVEGWEKAGMLAYSASVFNLLLATISFAFSVVSAIDTTVGTGIRPNPAEDVDFSGWSLSAGTMVFFLGLILLGFGKYTDLHRLIDSKGKGEEVQASAPVNDGPIDRDDA